MYMLYYIFILFHNEILVMHDVGFMTTLVIFSRNGNQSLMIRGWVSGDGKHH